MMLYQTKIAPDFRDNHGLVCVFADRNLRDLGDNKKQLVMPHREYYCKKFEPKHSRRILDRHCQYHEHPGPYLPDGHLSSLEGGYDHEHHMWSTYQLHTLPPTHMPAPVCSNQPAFETGEGRKKTVVLGMNKGQLHVVNPSTGWLGGTM